MSHNNAEADALFQGGGGGGAPSFDLGDGRVLDPNSPAYPVGKQVAGTIVSTRVMDQTELNSNPPVPKRDKNGVVLKQLQIVLQTALRNWEGVKKIPTNEHGQQLAPQDDDGKRAIYATGFPGSEYGLIAPLGEAVERAHGAPGAPHVGARLAVRVSDMGTPPGARGAMRKFQVRYEAPAAGAEMFQQPSAQQAPPQPQQGYQQPAQSAPPPQQQGWGQQPPAQQQPQPDRRPYHESSAQPQPDPWATQSATPDQSNGWSEEPPF